MPPVVLALFFCLIVVGGWYAWQVEKKRRQGFQRWARQNGWIYDHRRNATLRRQYSFLDRLQIGHSRHASHHLEGQWENYPATAFCFRYTTGSGKHQQVHSLGVVLLHLERSFPELRIYPENVLSRFGQFLGFEDIDFESVEFSKSFTVRSADKKFAYDFCNTKMMELLLQHRQSAIELEFDTLALFVPRYLQPADLPPMLQYLLQIRACMPGYLFHDLHSKTSAT